ncbi:MAG TPA: DALR anticodon-binding domain-containing protein, partial [Desulfuromonadaceae bacterium]
IILDKGYRVSLSACTDQALRLLEKKLTRPADDVKSDVLEFFRGRFVNLLGEQYPSDAVEAAVSAGFDDLVDVAARIAALAEFKNHPDFEPLSVAFKRVGNIIKEGTDVPVDPALFQEAAEGGLYEAFQAVKSSVEAKVAAAAWPEALTLIAGLRGPVDIFFDKVMVMAEDGRVRTNRLALLTAIARMFGRIADFSRIA